MEIYRKIAKILDIIYVRQFGLIIFSQKKKTEHISFKKAPAASQTTAWEVSSLATGWDRIKIRVQDIPREASSVPSNRPKFKKNSTVVKNLTEKLLLWTGERWIISLSKNSNAKSIYEQNMEKKSFEFVVQFICETET